MAYSGDLEERLRKAREYQASYRAEHAPDDDLPPGMSWDTLERLTPLPGDEHEGATDAQRNACACDALLELLRDHHPNHADGDLAAPLTWRAPPPPW